jgi:predicted adenylyl cyclase CyaB
MKEVEILVEVYEKKKDILAVLNQFKYIGKHKILDIYYNINKVHEWLRLRKKDNKSYITYKKDIYQKGRWIYSEETETEIKDIKTAKKILKILGLKELTRIDNIKLHIKPKNTR